MCSKFTGECPRRSEVSIKLLCIALIALLKSYFDMGVLLYICCIFSEHIFLRTPLEGCLWDKYFQKLLVMAAFGFDCFFNFYFIYLFFFLRKMLVCATSVFLTANMVPLISGFTLVLRTIYRTVLSKFFDKHFLSVYISEFNIEKWKLRKKRCHNIRG